MFNAKRIAFAVVLIGLFASQAFGQALAKERFHGELSVTDATTLTTEANSRIKMYKVRSKTEVAALGANDVVIIYDIVMATGAAQAPLSIFDGDDFTVDAGEIITVQTFGTSTIKGVWSGTVPYECQPGTYAHVKGTAANAVNVQIRGYIERH